MTDLEFVKSTIDLGILTFGEWCENKMVDIDIVDGDPEDDEDQFSYFSCVYLVNSDLPGVSTKQAILEELVRHWEEGATHVNFDGTYILLYSQNNNQDEESDEDLEVEDVREEYRNYVHIRRNYLKSVIVESESMIAELESDTNWVTAVCPVYWEDADIAAVARGEVPNHQEEPF